MTAPASWPTWTRLALTPDELHDPIDRLPAEPRLARALGTVLHRVLTGTGLPPSDPPKRWDEANVVDLLRTADREIRIVDHGGYNSPAPWALARAGFRHIDAIDLNPRLPASPFSRRIRYSCQNMMETAFTNHSFDCVISGSTVEHGVDWDLWLEECHRLLRPGGCLYVSTDLVADHVHTDELEAFGLPWTPLRPKDLAEAATRFEKHGFSRPDLPPIDLPDQLPISFLGHECGFIAFAVTAES